MVRKDATKLRTRFEGMDDHDVLRDIAVTQKFVEAHLKELNGKSVANARAIVENCADIASIKATCQERSRNPDKKFLIAMVVIAAVSGTLGANSDIIAKVLGIGG